MDSIIHSETYGEIIAYQDHLDSEAGQSRTFASLCKGTGLAGIGLSGLAMFTLPGWGGFALAGAAVGYVGAVIVEARKTGKLMPLPFVTLGLETVLKGVANAPGSHDDDGDELTHYHYLSAQEKSDYALLLLLGPEIAAALETLPTDTARRVAFSQMRRRFHQTYSRHIKDNPDMLAMGADKASLVEFILADADGLRQLASQPTAPALPATDLPPVAHEDSYTQTVEAPAIELPEADPWYSPAVGPVTRGSAIPVASTPVSEYVHQVPVVEPPTSTQHLAPKTALEQIRQSPYKSRIFFGAQRSGKSMLVAIASKQLADRGTKVYHLNLLSYAKEGLDEDAKYTRHCVRSVRGDISRLSGYEVTSLIEDSIALVHEWWNHEDAILIVDEWAYLAAKDCQFAVMLQNLVGLIAGKMSALNSSGMKRTQAIWAVAPKMVATNLTDSGKVIKSMECVYVTVPPNRTVDWQGQGVGFDEQLFDQVGNNYAITRPEMGAAGGDSRIAFVGDRWLPLGTTPDMLAEPLAHPRQLTIPAMPQSAVAVAEPVAAVDTAPVSLFDTPQYPEINGLIARCDEVSAGALRWLLEVGDGAEVTTSKAATHNWTAKALSAGKIPNRKSESIAPFFTKLEKLGFLKSTGEKTWEVTLR